VHQAINIKSIKRGVDHVIRFESPETSTHPEIAYAVRMGKRALKDKYLLTTLWNTFQSQAKIATLLNVNRSSVSRRCKEFNISQDPTVS